jgi:hypothetical protein
VLWFPKAWKEHIGKFKQHWFGPYKIQYCLPNNITLLVAIDKFDPNPVLVNINNLKPYRFQNTTASRGLESTIERGKGIVNIEMGFYIVTLENAQGTGRKNSFLIDKTKIHEPQFGTENQDSTVGTKIRNTLA